MEGIYTLETFAKKNNLTRQSALNLLSKLKKQNLIQTSGGGKQKRIYKISKLPKKEPNGFFTIINRYSDEKINPSFEHYIHGTYGIERAIIDGLLLKKDIRIRHSMYNLFRHIKDWKLLFHLAKKNNLVNEIHELYNEARKITKCKTMPKRYLK